MPNKKQKNAEEDVKKDISEDTLDPLMAENKDSKEIESLQKEVEDLKNRLARALADYQNLQREMVKRLDVERALLRMELIKDVIELADDIDVAIDHVEDEKGWREGVTRILEKFRSTIDKMGAQIIKANPGDKFDPSIHEAVGVVNFGEPDTISTVVQNGYKIEDMVVRPVRVLVNKISSK